VEKKLPKGWNRRQLNDLIEIHDNLRKPVKGSERQRGSIPYCGANGVIDSVNGFTHDGDFVLLAEDGGSYGSGDASAYLMTGRFWANNHVHILRGINGVVINEYLMYALKSIDLSSYLSGTTRPKLTQGAMRQISIPIPESIKTQHLIVAILSKAEEIKRLRAQADQLTYKMIQSVFFDMFGDPENNQKGWRVESLDSLCDELYRYPTFYGFDYIENGTPVVRISNILSDGFLDPIIANYASIDKEINRRFPRTILELNDILMAVRGDGSTAKRIGIVDQSSLVGSNISPNLIRFKTSKNKLNAIFLFYLLTSAGGQRLLEKYVTRTAKKTITAGEIKRIKIICPPISIQHDFEKVVRKAWSIKQEQKRSRTIADNFLDSLYQKAFTGELVT
jgi:type I restriction enzyme, S subunit